LRSEFRVRGSLREHSAWREALYPALSPQERDEGDERAQLRILAARCVRVLRNDCAIRKSEGAGKAGCPPHPRFACKKSTR
jgi:hypothetical protein